MAIGDIFEWITFFLTLLATIFFVFTTHNSFQKYLIKKSKSTLYLSTSYLFGLVGTLFVLTIAYYALINSSMDAGLTNAFTITIIGAYSSYVLSFLFIYLFAENLLFDDPLLFKEFHPIIVGLIIGILIDQGIHNEVLSFHNEIANTQIQTAIVDPIVALIIGVFYVYITLRILISFYIASGKVKNPERKLALKSIAVANLIFLLGSSAAATYPIVNNDVFFFGVTYAMTWIALVLGSFLTYVGWFQPNWFKNLFIKNP